MCGVGKAVCVVRRLWVGGDLTLEDLTGGVGGFLGPTGVAGRFLGPASTGAAVAAAVGLFLGPAPTVVVAAATRLFLGPGSCSGGGSGRRTLAGSCQATRLWVLGLV